MKGILGILMVIAVICPPGMSARRITVVNGDASAKCGSSVEPLARQLEKIDSFSASVRYEVALPMATDDVTYDITLASGCNKTDSLCGMNYLVSWRLPRAESVAEGFLAYFSGHHYRYRDNRLQEYHFEWDSIPFQTAGGGVQRNGQFIDLLPVSIARELRAMGRDTTFSLAYAADTLFEGNHVAMVNATQTINGFTARNYRLVADRSTGHPLKICNEYNPGQISEQSVEAVYDYATSPRLKAVASEEELMAMYPEVFEKFRESNYRIENLRGLPLPGFSLPTVTGERYTRHRGDGFKAPTVIALVDPVVDTSVSVVRGLREALDTMPMQVDLILAFTGNNIDIIESVAASARTGEALLMSAKAFARDCGTSVFPTILLVGSDGKVENVILGFNNNLSKDVIQMLALLR